MATVGVKGLNIWRLASYCGCQRPGGASASNMTDLLQVAGDVGKAVESLVTIMTDEEQQQGHSADHRPSSH